MNRSFRILTTFSFVNPTQREILDLTSLLYNSTTLPKNIPIVYVKDGIHYRCKKIEDHEKNLELLQELSTLDYKTPHALDSFFRIR